MHFLTYLAVEQKLASATQAHELAALQFLYKHVIDRPLVGLGAVPRAGAPVRLPVVLSVREVRLVLAALEGVPQLIGICSTEWLGLLECLSLRVKDVDFDRGQIRVRRGKGGRDE